MEEAVVRVQNELKKKVKNEGVLKLQELQDKPNNQMAYVLAQNISGDNLAPLRTLEGKLTHDPEIQVDLFAQYYQDIYKAEPMDEDDIRAFLKETTMLTLSEEHRELLDQPICMDEIEKAIAHLKINTAPGPDGFTPEFYKKFSGLLCPLLYELYNECFKGGEFLESWTIGKDDSDSQKGQDLSYPQAYLPIFLLNVEY